MGYYTLLEENSLFMALLWVEFCYKRESAVSVINAACPLFSYSLIVLLIAHYWRMCESSHCGTIPVPFCIDWDNLFKGFFYAESLEWIALLRIEAPVISIDCVWECVRKEISRNLCTNCLFWAQINSVIEELPSFFHRTVVYFSWIFFFWMLAYGFCVKKNFKYIYISLRIYFPQIN